MLWLLSEDWTGSKSVQSIIYEQSNTISYSWYRSIISTKKDQWSNDHKLMIRSDNSYKICVFFQWQDICDKCASSDIWREKW